MGIIAKLTDEARAAGGRALPSHRDGLVGALATDRGDHVRVGGRNILAVRWHAVVG